jgi:Family of unknown function (DUF6157)
MNHNYYDTFIEIAPDCPAESASVPTAKGDKPTIASRQYDMIANHPYKYTQEDVLFETYADANDIPAESRAAEREKFFSKGQACLRASALGKRYGWGVHNDADGKVALYAVESDEYKRFAADGNIKHLKAMRSKRA